MTNQNKEGDVLQNTPLNRDFTGGTTNSPKQSQQHYTDRLDIEALKRDEQAFRALIGDTPSGYGKPFAPQGLEGNSWTFFCATDGYYLLQRKSSNDVLDIISYGKAIGVSMQQLKERFPQYAIQSQSNALADWLSSHGLSRAELEQAGWQVSEQQLQYPVQTDEGIKYQTRKPGAEHSKRFHCDKGLKTSQYFYAPAELTGTDALVICAGASDALNAHYALNEKYDCIGVLGEGIIPSRLLELQYQSFIIAYGFKTRQGSKTLRSSHKGCRMPSWWTGHCFQISKTFRS